MFLGRCWKWFNTLFDHRTTKRTKWHVCLAKTQLSIRPVWSESLLCTQWVAKDPSFLQADSEDWSDWADAQADRSLRWAHISVCWFCREAAHFSLITQTTQVTYISMMTFCCERPRPENPKETTELREASTIIEPCHDIMALRQTCMSSHSVGLDVCFLVGPLLYFYTSCVWTAKALTWLCGRAGSSEPSPMW